MVKCFFNRVKMTADRLFNGRALYMILLILLTLSILIVSSLSWFTMNKNTNSDKMDMSLAVDDTTAVYKAFMYDKKSGMGVDIAPDGSVLDITNLDLNQYDTIFRAQNRYTPAFARITIVRSESMPWNGRVTITIDRDDRDAESGETGLTSFSSSTLRFTGFIMEDKSDLGLNDPNKLYSHISTKERFDAVERYRGNNYDNSQTFVTVVGEGEGHYHEKYTSIDIYVDYTENNWYKDAEGNDALNIYLYITYDVQLINCYMDEHQGGEISLTDNTFFFDNDLTEIRVSYKKDQE